MTKTAETITLAHYGAIVGKTVRSVRCLSPAELMAMGWEHTYEPVVEILMSDGTVVIPSQDPEMNGPGFLVIIKEEELS